MRPGSKSILLIASIALLAVAAWSSPIAVTGTASAATRPTVRWKASTLRPSYSTKTSSLLTTNSKGKQRWSVKGNCSVSKSRIKTKSSGKCEITVTIGAKSPYSSRTVRKTFKIVSPTPTPETFDPYAGAVASVDAAGTMSEGVLTTSDGRTRHYRTYIPAALPAGSAIPLVIALHGGLGTSSQFAANSGLNGFAESNKFIAVYPDGIGNQPDGTGYQTWNGGYCCGPAATQAVDDVAFIRNLVVKLRTTISIDPRRVYAMGHSNGGILAYKLACDLSDVIVAIGVQAGSNVVADCRPINPVSVFHLHGTTDTNMPINGGKGSGVSTTNFASARNAVDAMATVNACNVSSPTSLITSNSDVAALSWKSCKSNTGVRFVTVKNATHAWMGHAAQSAGASSYVGTPYPNLDATRAILSFLLSKSR